MKKNVRFHPLPYDHPMHVEARQEFLAGLRIGLSAEGAIRKSGATVTRRSFWMWRQNHPDFAAEWQDAVEAGTDRLEDEALRRAADGVEELVSVAGQVHTATRYSDRLLEFLLKGRRPERYGTRIEADMRVRSSALNVTITAQMSPREAADAYLSMIKTGGVPAPEGESDGDGGGGFFEQLPPGGEHDG